MALQIKRSNLTLFMPIKDRPKYFERALRYWSASGKSHPLLIADGSVSRWNQKENERHAQHYGVANQYFFYGPDKTYNHYLRKLQSSLRNLETQYLYWWCDDDFYNPVFLEEGMLFLDKYAGYSQFTAECLDFDVYPQSRQQSRKFGNSHGSFVLKKEHRYCSGRYLLQKSVESDDLVERINMMDACFPFEAVQVTRLCRDLVKACLFSQISDDYLFLQFQKFYTLISGKSYYADSIVSTLRQENTETHAGQNLPFFGASNIAVAYLNSVELTNSLNLFQIWFTQHRTAQLTKDETFQAFQVLEAQIREPISGASGTIKHQSDTPKRKLDKTRAAVRSVASKSRAVRRKFMLTRQPRFETKVEVENFRRDTIKLVRQAQLLVGLDPDFEHLLR